MGGTDLAMVWEICRRRSGVVLLTTLAATATAVVLAIARGVEARASLAISVGDRPANLSGGISGPIEMPGALERALLSDAVLAQVAGRAGLPAAAEILRGRVAVRTNPNNPVVEVRVTMRTGDQALAVAKALGDYAVERHEALLGPMVGVLQRHADRLGRIERSYAEAREQIQRHLTRAPVPSDVSDGFRYQVHVLASRKIDDEGANIARAQVDSELTAAGIRRTVVLAPPALLPRTLLPVVGAKAGLALLGGTFVGMLLAFWLERHRWLRAGDAA